MKWKIFAIAFLGVYFFSSTICLAEEKEDSFWDFLQRADIVLQFHGNAGHQFSNFPLSMRAVPKHPDDGAPGGNPYADDPLPDKKIYIRTNSSLGWRISWSPNEHTGFGIQMSGQNSLGPNTERYRQNQSGTPERGYGTSLRWYEVALEGAQVALTGFVATPRNPYTDRVFGRFLAGGSYAFTSVDLFLRSGYDRYNADEEWRYMDLGGIREHHLYAGWEIGLLGNNEEKEAVLYLQFLYVRSIPELKLTDEGAGLGLESNMQNNFAFGIGFGRGW